MNNTQKMITKDMKKYLAEFVGTMLLAFIGLGTLALSMRYEIFMPFAFGLALMSVIYIFGAISGAHVNPAVSLAFALKNKLSWKDFIMYVIAQVLGAIAGVAILFGLYKITFGGAFRIGEIYSTSAPTYARGLWASMILSTVLTFAFVLAWFGVTHKPENKHIAPLALGLALTAVLLAGAIVNPALNFAQAIFSGAMAMKQVWLFIIAPLVGAILAAAAACYFFHDEDKDEVKSNKPAPQLSDAKQTPKKK
jgi:aquaporin Z